MAKYLKGALLSASVLGLTAGSAHADFTLDILHINDLHSRIEAIGSSDSTCSTEDQEAGECFGGVARIKTKIDERRDALAGEGGNVLVLDAGDQFQGSLFYTTCKGEAEAEFMNAIGFDAMAIGNHEFDDGPEGLAAFIDLVEVPLISGNTVAEDGSLLDGKYEPSLVKEFGEERVGILSVLATDTDETSSPGDDISFEDEIAYLTDAVAEMEADGIDKIVLLSHVGYVRDQEIAAAVDGIDVIVGGHSHTLLSNTDEAAAGPYPTMVANPSGTEVPIVQAYAYSKYVGELRVVFDDDGNVISAEGDPHLLDNSVEPDAEVAARVEELAEPIQELMQERLSEATSEIDGSRETCRAEECEMGNLVADAMLERTHDQGVSLVIQNGGGLRASIDEGEITMGDVLGVLPFQNTLATFELKGADVVTALENGLSQYEEQAGRFAQVAGLRYTFDPALPVGERVVSVEVAEGDGFVPIDPDATYGVATNNYMRTGGDGYEIFNSAGTNAYDFGPGLEMVVADYLRENDPYEPYLDGRITLVRSDEDAAGIDGAGVDDAPAMEEPAAETTPADAMPDRTEPAEQAEPAETPEPAEPAEDDAAAADPIEPATPEAEATETPEAAGEEDDAAMADPIEAAPAEEDAMAAPTDAAPTAVEGMEQNTHTVARGDTLWDLAERYYGDPELWPLIEEANPDMLAGDLEVGATLAIPARP